MSAGMRGNDYPYRVRSTRVVTPVIRELHLAPDDRVLTYKPGQYVQLSDRQAQLPPRAYSVANAPRADGTISLLVTRVASGPTSSWVHEQLHAESPVMLSGPYGTFVPDPDQSGPVLLLAAGSGLAPARALAEALLDAARSRPVTLFFSARTGADLIDDVQWTDWAHTRNDFHYIRTLTRDATAPLHQRIPDLLSTAVGDLTGWEVFVSGPPGFVTGAAAAAERLGAERAAVHTEEFFTEPQPWTSIPPKPFSLSVGR